MAFDGFLSYGGTEILNAQRTRAYVQNLMPSFPLVHDKDYSQLNEALGDEPYRTPILDGAEWIEFDDPAYGIERNAGHGFLGLYPLSVEGLTDSSVSSGITEAIDDGGFASAPRASTRAVRVRGMLIGTDMLAAEFGLSWLRQVLSGGACSTCDSFAGNSLRFFLARPEVCIPLYRDNDWSVDERNTIGSINIGREVVPPNDLPADAPMRSTWEIDPGEGVVLRHGGRRLDDDQIIFEEEVTPLRTNHVFDGRLRANPVQWLISSGSYVEKLEEDGVGFGRVTQSAPIVTRRNLLPNPSFEYINVEGTGWRGSRTVERVGDSTAPQGEHAARVYGHPGQTSWIEATAVGVTETGLGNLSFWVRGAGTVRVITYDSRGVAESSDPIAVTDSWKRVSVSVDIRRGFSYRVQRGDALPLVVDGFLLELTDGAKDYFDGDSQNGNGVTNAYIDGSPSNASIRTWGDDQRVALRSDTSSPAGAAVVSARLRAPGGERNVTVTILNRKTGDVEARRTVRVGTTWSDFALFIENISRRAYVHIESTGQLDVTDVMLERGRVANPYFDGESKSPSGYKTRYQGAKYRSASIREWQGSFRHSEPFNWRPFIQVIAGKLAGVKHLMETAGEISLEDQLMPFDRSLHEVAVAQGPIKTSERELSGGGAYIIVDFIFTATTPAVYSTHGVDLNPVGATPRRITDHEVNRFEDPRFTKTSTSLSNSDTNWIVALTGGSTLVPFTVADGVATLPAVSTGYRIISPLVKALLVGHSVHPSFEVFSAEKGRAWVVTRLKTASGAVDTILSGDPVDIPGNETWTRIEMDPFIFPGGTVTQADFALYMETDIANNSFKVRRPTTTPGIYFDGTTGDSQPGYKSSWFGTPNASRSLRVPVRDTVPPAIVDPALPARPVTPKAPVIRDTSLESIDRWYRYAVNIPAGLVPLWAAAIVDLSIKSGSRAVRQVRLRFYAHSGTPSTEVDPGGYCGEFFITYLPPNSEMTISGIAKNAWVERPGLGEAPASHLLAGSDGLPPVWPELSCDTSYWMMVDTTDDTLLGTGNLSIVATMIGKE